MKIIEKVAAAYTKALLHNPEATIYQNMQRAFDECPAAKAAFEMRFSYATVIAAERFGLKIQVDTMTVIARAREQQFSKCREQRDDLLAALKIARWMLARDYIDDQKRKVMDKADTAIAKATGAA